VAEDVRRLDDGVLRFDVGESASLYVDEPARAVVLNETATAIWDVAGSAASVEAIVAVLAERYGATADELRPHVERTLHDLAAEGLVALDAG
jgi:hypothetical protein